MNLGVTSAMMYLRAAIPLSPPGDTTAALKLAQHLASGVGTVDGAADPTTAMVLARDAAAAGNWHAHAFVGDLFRQRPSQSAKHSAAIASYRRGASFGDRNAQYALAKYLISGAWCNKDAAEAKVLLEAASDQGHLLASFDLLQFSSPTVTLKQRLQKQQQNAVNAGFGIRKLALTPGCFFMDACRFGSGAVARMLDPSSLYENMCNLGVVKSPTSSSISSSTSFIDTICEMFGKVDVAGRSPVENLVMSGDLVGLKALVEYLHQQAIPHLCSTANLAVA
eukprot:gene17611-34052_t